MVRGFANLRFQINVTFIPTGVKREHICHDIHLAGNYYVRACKTLQRRVKKEHDVELSVVSGGVFKLDGGSMFGIVPKPLWEKICPPDEKNRITNDTNCLLIRKDGRLILVDTGYGDKMTDRDRGIYGMSGSTILGSLSARGVSAEDIDLVILSHLHFDHAGGATRMDEEGQAVPAFPNAQYVVQKGEWEDALDDYGTMKTTYRPENYVPLMDRGVLTLVEGDVEI